MSDPKPPKPVIDKIKQGSLSRQWQLTKTGIKAGSVAGTQMWGSLFLNKEKRKQRNSRILSEQAQYVAEELGKLKGAAVKIGQMMALYGEHLLPEELTQALRGLEENTAALAWPVIEQRLQEQLGSEYGYFAIEQQPLGAASLAQVHKAQDKRTGQWLCFKVQYPGVADAIDSDINSVMRLLSWVNMIQSDKGVDQWLDEIRRLLYQEVDYQLEAQKTQSFHQLLAQDAVLRVATVYPQWSSAVLLTTSFEEGFSVTDARTMQLSQRQRNTLAKSFLSLFLREVFDWGMLQTDPNFGNYRIRQVQDKVELVLLDFGSVMSYPEAFLVALQDIILGAYRQDTALIRSASIRLGVMQADFPDQVHDDFAQLCFLLLEPFGSKQHCPAYALNPQGQYCWANSQLPKRAAKLAANSAFSRYFAVPPKEFAFVSRKLLGVYSFIAALQAQFNPDELLQPYLQRRAP